MDVNYPDTWGDISLGGLTISEQDRTISGYVRTAGAAGVEAVEVSANNNGGSAVTDHTGHYEVHVPYDWSGTVTPSSELYDLIFEPGAWSYSNVTANISNQNFTASNYFDVNGDDKVDFLDLAGFAYNWSWGP